MNKKNPTEKQQQRQQQTNNATYRDSSLCRLLQISCGSRLMAALSRVIVFKFIVPSKFGNTIIPCTSDNTLQITET